MLDRHAFKIFSLWEAKEHLAKVGVKYDRIITDIVTVNGYTRDGIHKYFMAGDCDVACYTPIMGTLYVNDTPRQWSKEFLSRTSEVI